MFSGDPYKIELQRRISSISHILDAGDPLEAHSRPIDISREIRGISIVLLFACYENLITSLCRGLLERAAMLRVGNRRLKIGFRQFAIHSALKSISNSSESKIWKGRGRDLLGQAFESKTCTIDPEIFPSDGSFMRKSQVVLFFDIFNLGDPAKILKEVWDRIDTIVIERNKIAHGNLTPEEVGRSYSSAEIRILVQMWESRWSDVITHVESAASVREFYRD